MSNEEKWELCLQRAKAIVAAHRAEMPEGCDPKAWYVTTTLAAIAVASALIGAGMSAYGMQVQSSAQADAAKYNAAVNRNNAQSAMDQANFDANQIRDKNRRVLAQQRNAFAANGVVPDSGSAADVQRDSAQQGEMQALMAIYTGRTSANSFEARANLNQMEASNDQTAGMIGTGSSIIGGLGSAANIGINDAPAFQTKPAG